MKDVVSFSKLKTLFLAFISAQMPAKEVQQLAMLFKQIDKNNDGYLSVTEIQNILKDDGTNTTYAELHSVLKSMDLDKNGKINYNQFIAGMISDEYCQKKDYVESIFHYFDNDKNGKISRHQLQESIGKMGMEMPAKFIN